MDDDLFVVVSWGRYSQCFTSILQLERRGINHEYDPCTQEAPVVQSEFSVTFRLPLQPPPLRLRWGYALLADSPTEASLHMVPDWMSGAHEDDELHSCIFNLKTKNAKRVPPPHARKYGGHVVSLGVHTYFMAHPSKDTKAPDPRFERYDPLIDEWEKLHIPQDFITEYLSLKGSISATAVWDDTILLNLLDLQFWAYNVDKKKWYRVMVNKPWECAIEGEAIVIGDTIYALSPKDFDSVAVLSMEKGRNNDDLVYKCSLTKFIKVPGEYDIEFDYAEGCKMSRHLVHLGEDNFCLVHSCISERMEEYQHIQLTHIKLNIRLKGKKSMTVTNKSVHQFKLKSLNVQFEVRHCFSLPKCKTTDLKQGKTSFEFDPFPESFLSRRASKRKVRTIINLKHEVVKPVQEEENATLPKDSPLFDVQGATSELDARSNVASKASTKSAVIGHPSHAYEKASLALKGSTLSVGAAPERSNTDEEGHSICVVKLSSEASVRELVCVLKRYGPLMKVWIHVPTNATRKPCAYVEFENAAGMRLAIKASPITIGGRRAVIQNVRRNGSVPPAVQESHVSNHVDEVTESEVLNPPENGNVPVVQEEVKVTEVVDEVQDDSPPVSYAAIVKRSPFSSSAPVPMKFQESERRRLNVLNNKKNHMLLFSSLLIAFLFLCFYLH